MNINNIQVQNKKEEIKHDLLARGIEPNNYEINNLLSEFFETQTLGLPYYRPIKQKAYDVSSKENYNHNFKQLEVDLQNILECNIQANNKAVAMQEYYDTEKNKIINSLAKLSLRIDNVNQILNGVNGGVQYVENFDDFYGVEFYGNESRNIPYTTSFIDLLQRKVYTEKTNSNTNKLNLSSATITKTGSVGYDETKTVGDLKNILNDTMDSTYTYIEQSESLMESTIDILVDIGNPVTINTVMFKFTSSKSMQCTLSVSEDGENYLQVNSFSNSNLIEWNFPEKTIRYLKINCYKQEPDGVSIKNNLEQKEFYYILKNISIAYEEFEPKSILVTKPIVFDNLINSIKLNSTDMIFSNTRIDYFVGFDNGKDKVSWEKIENRKEYKLPMFEQKHKILNWSIENFSDEDKIASSLYQIYELPQNTNRNSIKVNPGYNMWSVKRYTLKEGQEAEATDFDFNNFDFSSFVSKSTEDSLFMDCENYDSFQLGANTMYVFTQYVEMDQSGSVYNKFIRAVNTSYQSLYKINQEKKYQKVFINGIEVSAVDDWYYSFMLKPGINKIQIAIFSTAVGTGNRLLYHNLNFKELTDNVFAFPPMKFVNWSVLEYQMVDNYNYYTIKGNKIFVKANPQEMIKSNLNDMGYLISYYSLSEAAAIYFNNNSISFRIMAVLNSNDSSLSPEIINMQIVGK